MPFSMFSAHHSHMIIRNCLQKQKCYPDTNVQIFS